MEENWTKANTLGGKEKLFWWNYDGEKITIKKERKDNSECIIDFSNNEIDMLIEYIKQKVKVPLANDVTKVPKGTEKDGIGNFIYNNISKDNDKFQSASQFVSIFLHINVIGYNGKKSNMEFWVINDNWKERLLGFKGN